MERKVVGSFHVNVFVVGEKFEVEVRVESGEPTVGQLRMLADALNRIADGQAMPHDGRTIIDLGGH